MVKEPIRPKQQVPDLLPQKPSKWVKILLKLLEDQADSAKVPHMEAYMKNKFRFLGVQKKQFSERLKESFLSLSLRIQLIGLL